MPRNDKAENAVREEDGMHSEHPSNSYKLPRNGGRGKTEKPQRGVADPSKENYNFGGLGPNFNRDWHERWAKQQTDDGKGQKLL